MFRRPAVTAALVLWTAAAAAEPQMLGLVATKDVPVRCTDGVCAAELTTFCLHHDRGVPEAGTVYRIAEGALEVTDGAGRTHRVAAQRLAAERGMVAIRVVFAAPGIDGPARLSVAANTSLQPVVARAARPFTPAEVAHAKTVLRPLGTRLVDAAADMPAALALNRALNALAAREAAPQPGAVAVSTRDAAAGERDAAMAAVRGEPAAERIVSRCAERAGLWWIERDGLQGVYGYWSGRAILAERVSMRQCLAAAHDAIATDANERYWRAAAVLN